MYPESNTSRMASYVKAVAVVDQTILRNLWKTTKKRANERHIIAVVSELPSLPTTLLVYVFASITAQTRATERKLTRVTSALLLTLISVVGEDREETPDGVAGG